MASAPGNAADNAPAAFRLRAPSSADKPTNPPRVGGLTGKKPTPRPKAFVKEEQAKEDESTGDLKASKEEPKKVDSKLIKWLRSGNCPNRECFFEAKEYLLAGPPYRGNCNFKAKEAVKKLGARWVVNPNKVKGAKDGVASGWWSAWDEEVLKALLDMPEKDDGTRDWQPLNVPDEYAMQILKLMRLCESMENADRQFLDRKARMQRDAKEIEQQQRRRIEGVPQDSQEEIDAFETEFDIKITEEMLDAASHAAKLGPHIGISRIYRLKRGLALKVISIDDVRKLDFSENVFAGAKRKRQQ